ncbi:MAG: cytochrome c [Bryobacteraceae bacterium]|nr:cytochrome c [Bryobacteraceae bacterium]
MKRILYVVAGLVAAAGGALGYLWLKKPNMRPAPQLKILASPATLERGRYLYDNLLECDGCHSPRDFSRFGGPVLEGRRGAGQTFPPEMGLPGTVSAANITSDRETGIGAWTDGEVLRAIREGVSRDGRALFMMPYTFYKDMSDDDAQALVAYVRTLPAVRNELPATAIDFPVNLLFKLAPAPVETVAAPDRADKLKYGAYLVGIAGCKECHSPFEKGQVVEEKAFAGGREFRVGTARVISANITPDTQTGLGKMTEDQFVEKVYQYKDYVKNGPPKAGDDAFTLMPWLAYAGLEEGDLRAMHAYLRTVKPIVNSVETHPDQAK